MIPADNMANSASLNSEQRRLAAATKRAVQSAGGGKVCEFEATVSDSSLSCYGSPNDDRFIPIDKAVRIDAIGARESGYPHILGTMASIIGAVVIMLPDPGGEDGWLLMDVCELTTGVGDLARKIGDALNCTSEGGRKVTAAEAEAGLIQVGHLERKTATLRHRLERIAEQPP